MKAKWTLFPLLMFVSCGLAIAAGSGEMSTDDQMAKLDANGDGVISVDEASAHSGLAARFDELDQNGDQELDRGEFAQFELEQMREDKDY